MKIKLASTVFDDKQINMGDSERQRTHSVCVANETAEERDKDM